MSSTHTPLVIILLQHHTLICFISHKIYKAAVISGKMVGLESTGETMQLILLNETDLINTG